MDDMVLHRAEVCHAWNVGLVLLHLVLVRMFPGQNSQGNASAMGKDRVASSST